VVVFLTLLEIRTASGKFDAGSTALLLATEVLGGVLRGLIAGCVAFAPVRKAAIVIMTWGGLRAPSRSRARTFAPGSGGPRNARVDDLRDRHLQILFQALTLPRVAAGALAPPAQ